MSTDVTRILNAIAKGSARAAADLLPLVYTELRRLASHKLAQERSGQTHEPTALVHEAYLRLVKVKAPDQWEGRGHFFAAAAEAMRRILVDNARKKKRARHGGKYGRVDLPDVPDAAADERILALHEALIKLAEEDETAARVVELRYFAGLGHEQIASVLGITVYQARQKWTYARAWLRDAIDK